MILSLLIHKLQSILNTHGDVSTSECLEVFNSEGGSELRCGQINDVTYSDSEVLLNAVEEVEEVEGDYTEAYKLATELVQKNEENPLGRLIRKLDEDDKWTIRDAIADGIVLQKSKGEDKDGTN